VENGVFIYFDEEANDKTIILDHVGKPMDRVKCIVEDREYGNIPIKVIRMIQMNIIHSFLL
jgi:hypothetical protein